MSIVQVVCDWDMESHLLPCPMGCGRPYTPERCPLGADRLPWSTALERSCEGLALWDKRGNILKITEFRKQLFLSLPTVAFLAGSHKTHTDSCNLCLLQFSSRLWRWTLVKEEG